MKIQSRRWEGRRCPTEERGPPRGADSAREPLISSHTPLTSKAASTSYTPSSSLVAISAIVASFFSVFSLLKRRPSPFASAISSLFFAAADISLEQKVIEEQRERATIEQGGRWTKECTGGE